jgi:hypothetical protein
MTHKERDCLERPRKLGAWKTGAQIAPDEVLTGVAAANLKLPYFLLCGLALIPGLIQSPSQASLSVLSA